MINKKHLANLSKYSKDFSKNKPFPNIVLDSFFDEKYLDDVRNSLGTENFIHKDSDLFEFYQTNDLASSKIPKVIEFRKYLLSEEFMKFIEELTSVKLKRNKISIHSTLYTDTHYLLCHDDQLDDRRLAIMIYLSDLKEQNGGKLVLYDSDSKGKKPKNAVVNITPKFNRFAIFKIGEKSFHEVTEVTGNKPRLAIGWWYYDK
jgi:Rps23 Pro-64 3,4-dihydroxylase Tpa1-like proline 4-hydroxylase